MDSLNIEPQIFCDLIKTEEIVMEYKQKIEAWALLVKLKIAKKQKGQGEKVVKYRWQPRNGCDGRSMTKLS